MTGAITYTRSLSESAVTLAQAEARARAYAASTTYTNSNFRLGTNCYAFALHMRSALGTMHNMSPHTHTHTRTYTVLYTHIHIYTEDLAPPTAPPRVHRLASDSEEEVKEEVEALTNRSALGMLYHTHTHAHTPHAQTQRISLRQPRHRVCNG